ncbi:MAG TPA: hypothetical protein VM536_13935, partial [Chloroflexia bacterium]|nr:hypothetical protein [Chloroflexia bacterium]
MTARLAFGAALAASGLGAFAVLTSGPKTLLLATPLADWPDLGDYAWNTLAQSQPVAILLWLLVVEGPGLLAWPLTATVCQGLPDRG